MAMESIPVQSSAIAYMSYDAETQTLSFAFNRGGNYVIQGIEEIEVYRWANSGSPGGYFNAFIKGKYGNG